VQLWPAIDIAHGRCVRLLRGDFGAETVYGDPEEVAESYLASGAKRLHLVDLDAARTGEPVNRDLIVRIARRSAVSVQVGGGIRSSEDATALLANGVRRVVLGTAVLEQPDLIERLSTAWPGRIVAGLDHRRLTARAAPSAGDPVQGAAGTGDAVAPDTGRREVAVRGWTEGSGTTLQEALRSLSRLELAAVVVTDISRDGTLGGPDLEGLALALAATELPIVASGGVGRADDLADLARLSSGGRRLAGVIVGTALLSGAFSLPDGEAVLARAADSAD